MAIATGSVLNPKERKLFLSNLQRMKRRGFDFDGAKASLFLLAQRARRNYFSPFRILEFEVAVRSRLSEGLFSEAIVKVEVKGQIKKEVAEGNGPVNALDYALRKALSGSYPCLEMVSLRDYRVNILNGKNGTASAVRVLIWFSDREKEWVTVGCSVNIVEASLQALRDGLEFGLL